MVVHSNTVAPTTALHFTTRVMVDKIAREEWGTGLGTYAQTFSDFVTATISSSIKELNFPKQNEFSIQKERGANPIIVTAIK